MNRRILTAVALLALAGCTSSSDMLKKDPVFYGHTQRTPQAYAACVADSWRRQGEDVKVSNIDNGVDVTIGGVTGMAAALRVQQWANGGVEIRMSARSSWGSQEQVQAANLCM
jgi:predicted transcriptional regulator